MHVDYDEVANRPVTVVFPTPMDPEIISVGTRFADMSDPLGCVLAP